MLYDPLPAIRAAVVSGTCSICEKYWELLPGEIIKDLINCIINDLAYDFSSIEVRASVFRVRITELIYSSYLNDNILSILSQFCRIYYPSKLGIHLVFLTDTQKNPENFNLAYQLS